MSDDGLGSLSREQSVIWIPVASVEDETLLTSNVIAYDSGVASSCFGKKVRSGVSKSSKVSQEPLKRGGVLFLEASIP